MATARARLSQKQRALLGFLRQKAGSTISEGDILKVTGWKASAWRVYRNNGLYAPYLREHVCRASHSVVIHRMVPSAIAGRWLS